jgi:hypothetical protein
LETPFNNKHTLQSLKRHDACYTNSLLTKAVTNMKKLRQTIGCWNGRSPMLQLGKAK